MIIKHPTAVVVNYWITIVKKYQTIGSVIEIYNARFVTRYCNTSNRQFLSTSQKKKKQSNYFASVGAAF